MLTVTFILAVGASRIGVIRTPGVLASLSLLVTLATKDTLRSACLMSMAGHGSGAQTTLTSFEVGHQT